MSGQVADKQLAAAFKRLQAIKLRDCFNPDDLESRPTSKQLEVLQDTEHLHRFVVAGNRSGKTQLGAREVSWWFDDCHPYMERPAEWGTGPLMILVIGRVGKQIEEEIWNNKIKPYLMPGNYKEVRTGQELQKVINLKTGNRIIFLSHHNVDQAREKAQAFTAQYVWLDEMPASISLVAELMLRVSTGRGRFLATFTPLIRNDEIMKMVENCNPLYAKKYKFSMLDNPMFKGREAEAAAGLEHVPAAERAARLHGDWYIGDLAVYPFDPIRHYEMPIGYSALAWPHVEAIDPAASGRVGLVVAAFSPHTKRWYVVKDEYIEGTAPSELVQYVWESNRGLHIIRRVCDPHENWFRKEALIARDSRPAINYMGVWKKTERKKELITGVQNALQTDTLRLAPACRNMGKELTNCQWSETTDGKIVNSSKYHLADALQYLVDVLPKDLVVAEAPKTFDQEMRVANIKRKEKEASLKKVARSKRSRWARSW